MAAAAFLAAALVLRLCRAGAPVRRSPAPAPLAIPAPPPALPPLPVPEPRPRLNTPGPVSPERDLGSWIAGLGRARLLRDRRTLERLRNEVPALREADLSWLEDRLGADLFTAAGAAELLRWYRVSRAVAPLSKALGRDVHPFLKEVLIEALADIGGEAAAVGLSEALRLDPDSGVRSRCARALGGFESLEAYQALVAAVRDPAPSVRSAAADSLRGLKSPQAVEILLAALRIEREARVQADLAVSAYAAGGTRILPALRELLRDRLEASAVLELRWRLQGDARYARLYDSRFFEDGQPAIPWDPGAPRIGITVELGDGVSLADVAGAVFSAAPFDRYRAWFLLRRSDEFPRPAAYDSYGVPAGDVPYGDLDGTVYLHFRDAASFKPGVLGFAEGGRAYVQPVSLLHEMGHAFARLADEYPGGSTSETWNLTRREDVPWQRLVDTGILGPPAPRGDGFRVPSENCHMGNRPGATRYCPVCQLEIAARLSGLTGLPPPW